MSKFQIILTAVFIIFIVAGVTLFATYKSNTSSSSLPTITVWGTFSDSVFSTLIQQINNTRQSPISINYVEKSASSFNKDFIESLARGEGPDAILVSQDMILRHKDKIIPIPFSVLTERDFKNTYINEAELYLSPLGTLALPFTVDPLVMYWNRDLFTNAGIATYPRYWDEFSNIGDRINLKDVNSNIRRSSVALGEFANINHPREILGTLLLQAGNPITTRKDSEIISTIGDGEYSGSQSSSKAISFFTQFSNPGNKAYSWNRSLPSSKSWFLSGSLATYFGFASELFDIRSKNPNLDFDIAPFPQSRNSKNRVTYGSMYGFSIVKSSRDQASTFGVLQVLTSPDVLNMLNQISYLPPVRRDMLATGSTDPYQAIFYDSAIISRSWLDMDNAKTNSILANMVESITSGKLEIYGAIQTAHQELEMSIRNP